MSSLMIILAKYFYLIIPFLAALLFLKQKRNVQGKIIIFTILTLPIAFIIAKLAGHFFYDPRPFVSGHFIPLIPHKPDNGFPSDHALLSFAIASIIFVFNKKPGVLLFVFGLIVGISRVYVGVHSPIDILGSFVISIIAGYISYLLIEKVKIQEKIVKKAY